MEAQAYLDHDQTKLLEDAARCPRDRILIRIYRVTGCRVSEAIQLHLENVNFDAHLLQIVHQKAQTKAVCPKCKKPLGKDFKMCPRCAIPVEKMVQKVIEKKKMRTIPIDAVTLRMIKEYKETTNLRWDGKGHVLFDINRKRAYQIVREASIHAGLPDILNKETNKLHHVSPHKLRDALAVNAMKKDRSMQGARLLQEMLGHASIGTTMNYDKIAADELTKWYEKMNEEDKA